MTINFQIHDTVVVVAVEAPTIKIILNGQNVLTSLILIVLKFNEFSYFRFSFLVDS